MEKEFGDMGFITFVLAGLSYLALACYLIINKQSRHGNLWLTTAIFISAVWSFAIGAAFIGAQDVIFFLPFLETLRGVTWVIFFSLLLARIWKMQGNEKLGKKLFLYLFPFLLFTLSLSLLRTGLVSGFFRL